MFAIGFPPIGALCLAVFGLFPLYVGALTMVLPGVVVAIVIGVWKPAAGKMIAVGPATGLTAVVGYDAFRLTLNAAGLWPDFIPKIGGYLLGSTEPNTVIGYGWRWLGNGGGMGMAFSVAWVTFEQYLPQSVTRRVIPIAVAYGVLVWACLLLTILIAPLSSEMLFELTVKSLVLSLIGHLIFGAVIGVVMRNRGRVTLGGRADLDIAGTRDRRAATPISPVLAATKLTSENHAIPQIEAAPTNDHAARALGVSRATTYTMLKEVRDVPGAAGVPA